MIKEGDNYIPSQSDIVATSDFKQVSDNIVITQETAGTNSSAQ